MIIPITTPISDKSYLDTFKSVQEKIKANNYADSYNYYSNYELDYYANLLEWLYEDLMDSKRDIIRSFIDIGCAYGTILHFIKAVKPFDLIRVVGLDLRADFFDKLFGSECFIDFYLKNIELDYFESQYDRIFLSETLEHFNFNPIPTMKRINSMLSDNGLLYLSTPDSKYWGELNKYGCHFSAFPLPDKNAIILDEHIIQYSRKDLLELLEMTGFEIVKDKNTLPDNGFQHFNMALKKKV